MHACMYACMHVCMRACMHVCRSCTKVRRYVGTYIRTYVRTHAFMYCMHACMHACMHVCMYICGTAYIFMYIHIHNLCIPTYPNYLATSPAPFPASIAIHRDSAGAKAAARAKITKKWWIIVSGSFGYITLIHSDNFYKTRDGRETASHP